jgi:beta-N-acetylhexosaminidase
MRRLALVIAAVLVVGCTSLPASGTGSARTSPTPQSPAPTLPIQPTLPPPTTSRPTMPPPSASAAPTLAQMIGQKLIVRMDGRTPSADLLGRIRRGEVGGVILFGPNITTRAALIALTTELRAAAKAGGQPRLIIAVDQEGGAIKRIPWAPPTLSPPEMGRIGKASVARSQGASTGQALHDLGINVDLAPVADVPSSTSSFMYLDGRTFSFSASRTALLSDAFASGLLSAGVVPTMKHFPGLGRATANTDRNVVTIRASRATLAPGLLPYQTAIPHRLPMIMLSNATYTAYDANNAAGWSHAISVDLLRGKLGFTGVTITDSLDGTASARGVATWRLAVRAAKAGTDMILATGSEATTRTVYAELLAFAKDGRIPKVPLLASYDRIIALKAGL